MAVVAIVVVFVLLAAAAGLLVLRGLGLDPEWLARAVHTLREARWRAAGVLAEFGDWLRLGR